MTERKTTTVQQTPNGGFTASSNGVPFTKDDLDAIDKMAEATRPLVLYSLMAQTEAEHGCIIIGEKKFHTVAEYEAVYGKFFDKGIRTDVKSSKKGTVVCQITGGEEDR